MRMNARRILIVEDESIVRLHLRRIVEAMGHQVVGQAATAAEAISRAAETAPELVIIDIHLGDHSDGVEAAREIALRQGSAILFATAFADDVTIARTSEVGAVGYLVKPFGEQAVRAAIVTGLREHDRNLTSRRSADELAGIIGSLGEAVLRIDGSLKVRYLNRRADALVFAPGGDAVGRDLRGLLRPADGDGDGFWNALVGACRDRVPALTPTVRLQLPDGTQVVVNGSIEPVANGKDDQEAGCVISLRDVSRRWFGPPTNGGRRAEETPRMIIYSHDTFGLGHLRRSLNLAAALVRAVDDLSILLVTGSAVAHRFPLPPRVDYVKLPAVRKTADEQYASRSLSMPDDDVRTLRANLIEQVVRDFRPHLLLADHAPAGMRGELRPALSWLRENLPECRTIVGLRDIIDEPAAVAENWHRLEIYRLLEEAYDHVVVYGHRTFFDPVTAYQMPPAVAARVRFVGHVVEAPGAETPPPPSGRRIVVTTGGGDGAVDTLAGGFLRMLAEHPLPADVETIVFPGPLAPTETVAALHQAAAGLPVTIHEFVESTSPWMATADLVVCTGGYNTTMQALRYARRILIVPRALHRQEQSLRAARLVELGLATCLNAGDLSTASLHAAVTTLLADTREPLTAARDAGTMTFDGANGLAAFCATLLATIGSEAEATHE
jgi:predicted glycosyltransferase/AmiR/NasT family two-component response regulator